MNETFILRKVLIRGRKELEEKQMKKQESLQKSFMELIGPKSVSSEVATFRPKPSFFFKVVSRNPVLTVLEFQFF